MSAFGETSSYRAGDACAARWPSVTFTLESSIAPTTKNAMTLRIALRLDPVVRARQLEGRRPRDRAELLEDREESEELGGSVARDHAGEQRSTQRLASALHGRHHQRQHVEIALRLHEVAHDAD